MPVLVRSNELRVTSNALNVNCYPLIVNQKKPPCRETRQARNSLVLENQFLARNIASKVWKANPHLPFDDLVSAGIIGLIKAIDRYNSSQAKLSTFAYPYIYGEIQREIRDKWQPLKIQRKHYELKNKLRKLDELGLNETAIALELNITAEDLQETREALAALGVSEISAVVEDDSSADLTSNEEPLLVTCYSLLKSSPRMKEIFELICCWGRTTTEAIAHHLNITQGRARDYTGRLRKAGLIIKDGFFYQPNFERVVVEGIKKQVQQKIDVTNFLAKLEELMKIKAQVKKLEDEIVKMGGDRTKWLIESLAVKNEK